jgi:hypothetical protein
MKWVIVVVVMLHLGFVALCFGAAILNPERSGLAPVFVYLADLPASFFCEVLRHRLHDWGPEDYYGRLGMDAFVYAVVGSAWWVVVAWGLGSLNSLLRSNAGGRGRSKDKPDDAACRDIPD